MSEEKHFAATQGRVERAKREGDIPRSSDFTSTASFACAALCLFFALPVLVEAAERCASAALEQERIPGGACAVLSLGALFPMFGAIGGAVALTLLQSRRLIFVTPTLKFEKLNPIKGLKRMFSRDALVAVAKSSCAAALTSFALFPCVRLLLGTGGTPFHLAALVLHALETIVEAVSIVGLAFGALDFLLENAKWRRRLRMSFEEFKRDLKQSEGDPHVRNRRRQAHRSFLRGSISRLREAAFVVVNPTHVAVALEYHPPEVEVPRVLIRAVDEGAQLVKSRARELGIPLIENVALARALLASTEVGSYIPPESYVAVAQIVTALLRQGYQRIEK